MCVLKTQFCRVKVKKKERKKERKKHEERAWKKPVTLLKAVGTIPERMPGMKGRVWL